MEGRYASRANSKGIDRDSNMAFAPAKNVGVCNTAAAPRLPDAAAATRIADADFEF